MNNRSLPFTQTKFWRIIGDSDRMYRWANFAICLLLMLLACLKSLQIYSDHPGLTFMQRALIPMGIFLGLWVFYRLCFWLAKPLLLGYAKAKQLNAKIDSELAEFDDCLRIIQKEELATDVGKPVDTSVTETVVDDIRHDNEVQNAYQNLSVFFKMLDQERAQLKAKKEAEEAKKLELIQKYTRQTFLPHGFTNEEMVQLHHCVEVFATLRTPLISPSIKIMRKKSLTQNDIKHFCWNIANAYGIPMPQAALFGFHTFHAWFANTEPSTIEKTLRASSRSERIPIVEDVETAISRSAGH